LRVRAVRTLTRTERTAAQVTYHPTLNTVQGPSPRRGHLSCAHLCEVRRSHPALKIGQGYANPGPVDRWTGEPVAAGAHRRLPRLVLGDGGVDPD
jgi:hypothetical protein